MTHSVLNGLRQKCLIVRSNGPVYTVSTFGAVPGDDMTNVAVIVPSIRACFASAVREFRADTQATSLAVRSRSSVAVFQL